MKSASGKELARALERQGWQLLRIHGNKPLKTGLLRHLLKMAGLDESAL
ncbi:MAG TPA: type II toxin-antitoxin system HicA family toxin [Terriglobia bacterium]|nr:type II toxin-antitoxin system HicA family toxin [Terriglobia bacterium]